MRKLLVSSLLLALFATFSLSSGVLACGAEKANAKSANAGSASCSAKSDNANASSADADLAGASNPACVGTASSASAAGAACGSKGTNASAAGYSCNSKGTNASAAGYSCGSKSANTTTALADPYLSSYMNVKSAMVKGCSKSASTAAASYASAVDADLAGVETDADRERLASLETILSTWPNEREAQKESFTALTEWTINYCETYPERANGTNVHTCPVSGKQWVQTDEDSGNPYSG